MSSVTDLAKPSVDVPLVVPIKLITLFIWHYSLQSYGTTSLDTFLLTLEFKPPRNIYSKLQQSLWRGKFKSEQNARVCSGVLLCQPRIPPTIHWLGTGCSKTMHRWGFSEDGVLVLRLDMHLSSLLAELNTEKSLGTNLKHMFKILLFPHTYLKT